MRFALNNLYSVQFRLINSTLFITLCVLAISFFSHSSHSLKGVKKITQVEGISEYRLSNGLQVLLYPDQTKDSITVNVTYYVGSKHENYGETGMAHLLEHLLFKGTPKHPNIPDELSARGAKPNGTTSQDRTNYYETFPASEDNLKWALGLEADRMVNSFVKEEDLNSEMTVVRNELERGENNPFRVTLQKMRAAAYMWHNYGKSPIGAISDLENVSIKRLQKFYKTYYQPDNATLIIAGKFDEQQALKLVKKTFGKIKKPKRPLPPIYTKEPASDGEREVTVRRVGDIKLTLFSYHTPAAAHIDNAAIELLAYILGDTPTGRLHKALVETKLATQVFAWSDVNADSSQFMAGAVLNKTDSIAKAEKEIIDQIEKVKNTPITEQEFQRAKRALLNSFEKSANNTESVAIGLSDWVTAGDWRLRFLRRDQIESVSIDQIQKVADKYLLNSNRTIGRFIPTEEPKRVSLPEPPNLNDLLSGYTGNKNIVLGEAFDPSYQNIHNNIIKETIADTIKLAYLKKKTRGEKVNIAMRLNYGDANSLAGTHRFSDVFSQMLTKGSKSKTRENIQDRLDELNTQVSFSSSAGSTIVNIDTQKANVNASIELVSELLRESTFAQKELELVKAKMKTSLEFALQDPNRIAQTAAYKRLTPVDKDHPAYQPSISEQIDYLSTYGAEELRQYHEQFLSADNMLISVVGDVDEISLKEAINSHFGQWKKGVTYEKITLPYKAINNTPLVFDTPDKENGIFLAVDLFNLNADHPDYPALKLGNTIFGGGFINSRLATRMRQKEGWSYGAGASVNGAKISPRTQAIAYSIGAPQNLEKIENAYKEELLLLLNDGFTDTEIENAKTGIKQRAKLARSKDASLVQMMLSDLFYEETFLDALEDEKALLELTKEQTQSVMKKYFSVENTLYIKAGDMKKALSEK